MVLSSPLLIHWEPFIRLRGFLSRKDCGVGAEWKGAAVKEVEQRSDKPHIIVAAKLQQGDPGGDWSSVVGLWRRCWWERGFQFSSDVKD